MKGIALCLALIWRPCGVSAQKASPDNPSLQEKAVRFEEVIRERHVKSGLIRELTLNEPANPAKGGILHSNDNDGLWTSLYVAAMSFKVAVLKDENARKWARTSSHALERLENITGIPGFPARSFVKAGDLKKYRYDGEWHKDVSGKWEWKGDTSSDELDGHFFAYSIYFDLAADGAEKKRVERLIRRVMDHIIDHDWYLVDLDGKPTRWGVWNPEQLNDNKPIHGLSDENWTEERGLNSLEILSHLKVAFHITGNQKYQEKYLELIRDHGYAANTLQVLDVKDLNHSDVELAFLAYYPLLKYETDPELTAIYRKSMKNAWTIVKPEENPWWNFTVCAFSPENCEISESVETLNEVALEQINRKGSGLQRWNGNPYEPVSGNGEIEGDGVLFLLPYWMGRHHNFIK